MTEEYESDGSAAEDECEKTDTNNNNNQRHFRNERRFLRQLMRFSDEFTDNDLNTVAIIPEDKIDVSAWDNLDPNPKYLLNIKKKKLDSLSIETDLTNASSSLHTKRDFELEFVRCPAWRIGVEPVTYRYMPNNGRYRASKLAKRLHVPKAFKKSFSTPKLSSDSTHLKSEIHRELRKEFEMFISLERQQSIVKRQQEAKEQREQRISNGIKTHTEYRFTRKKSEPNIAQASRHDSTSVKTKDASRDAKYSSTLIQRTVPPFDLQHLSKDQGEAYLEQVSSRLRELQTNITDGKCDVERQQHEGYLKAAGYPKPNSDIKHSSNQPQFATVAGSSLNKHKKVPAIMNDVHKHRPLDGARKKNYFSSTESLPPANDTNSPVHLATEQNSNTRMASQQMLDTPRTTLHLPHPLLYYPPDLGQSSESINKAQGFASKSRRKELEERKNDADAPIQLFSDYKLRKAIDNPFNEVDSETYSLIGNIRSSYSELANGVGVSLSEDDAISIEARVDNKTNKDCSVTKATPTRYSDPRGSNVTPNYEDYARSQVLHHPSGSARHGAGNQPERFDDSHLVLTNFVAERKRNSVVSTHTQRTRNALALAKRLPGETSLGETAKLAVGANFMPKVMVRRAEIAATVKRII